jgi:hypothetical protein
MKHHTFSKQHCCRELLCVQRDPRCGDFGSLCMLKQTLLIEQAGPGVMLQTCIRETVGLNLCRDTVNPD